MTMMRSLDLIASCRQQFGLYSKLNDYYESMSVQFAAISKSGKNDNF